MSDTEIISVTKVKVNLQTADMLISIFQEAKLKLMERYEKDKDKDAILIVLIPKLEETKT